MSPEPRISVDGTRRPPGDERGRPAWGTKAPPPKTQWRPLRGAANAMRRVGHCLTRLPPVLRWWQRRDARRALALLFPEEVAQERTYLKWRRDFLWEIMVVLSQVSGFRYVVTHGWPWYALTASLVACGLSAVTFMARLRGRVPRPPRGPWRA